MTICLQYQVQFQLDPAKVKMDIPELDQDVIVQQSSAGLISDFDRSLGPFLRKPNGHLRSRVRVQEVARLTSQVRPSLILSLHVPSGSVEID